MDLYLLLLNLVYELAHLQVVPLDDVLQFAVIFLSTLSLLFFEKSLHLNLEFIQLALVLLLSQPPLVSFSSDVRLSLFLLFHVHLLQLLVVTFVVDFKLLLFRVQLISQFLDFLMSILPFLPQHLNLKLILLFLVSQDLILGIHLAVIVQELLFLVAQMLDIVLKLLQ